MRVCCIRGEYVLMLMEICNCLIMDWTVLWRGGNCVWEMYGPNEALPRSPPSYETFGSSLANGLEWGSHCACGGPWCTSPSTWRKAKLHPPAYVTSSPRCSTQPMKHPKELWSLQYSDYSSKPPASGTYRRRKYVIIFWSYRWHNVVGSSACWPFPEKKTSTPSNAKCRLSLVVVSVNTP